MEEQALKKALHPGPDCISAEQLGRYADGALPAREHAAVHAHVVSCVNCQSEMALLQAFTTLTVSDQEAAAVNAGVGALRRRETEIFGDNARPRMSLRRWMAVSTMRPAAAAAVVLLGMIGGYYLTRPARPGFPTDIGTRSDTTRSLAVALRAPVGDVAQAPERFEWAPVDGASRYRVRLTEVDRREIWSGETPDTAIVIPAPVRVQVVPSKTLLWHVTAYDAAGTPIAESDLQRFRLVR
jgi:hypothetical protein